jgi:hypothetical protein
MLVVRAACKKRPPKKSRMNNCATSLSLQEFEIFEFRDHDVFGKCEEKFASTEKVYLTDAKQEK